jgi:hypothetical protein
MVTRRNKSDEPVSIIEEENLGDYIDADEFCWGILVKLKAGYECKYCAETTGLVYESGPHFRLDCAKCHRFIKFNPKTPWLIEQLETPIEPEAVTQ